MILFTTIVFAVALLVLVSLFLVKLGQAHQRPPIRIRVAEHLAPHQDSLRDYFARKAAMIGRQLWHFILEAKDLKPAANTKTLFTQVEQRVKSAFRIRVRTSEAEPQWLPEAASLSVQQEPTYSPEELYLQAIKKNPTDRQAYEALGRLYLQNRNFTDAAEIFEYLIKLDPSRDTYFSNLGLSYYSLKEFQKAAISYEKAVAINNKIPTRWVNLALCFQAQDMPAKALKALTQACNLDKLNTAYMMLLSDTYLELENSVRAEEVLEQILVLEPTNRLVREKLMKLKI